MSTFKTAFTSRFGQDEGIIMEVDWNQLEINCLQIESDDLVLATELIEGKDLHTAMCADIYHTSYKDVTDAINAVVPKWVERRKQTKRARFALQYGAGKRRISELTGWTLEEAQQFIDKYHDKYKDLKSWEDAVALEVNYSAKPWGPDGCKKGQYTSPTGRRFVFVAKDNKYRPGEYTFSPNQLKNWPIQGLAADFVAHMTGKLFRDILYYDVGQYVMLVNTIHDSVVLDVHKEVLDIAEQIVHDVYSKAPEGMREVVQGKRSVNIPLKYSITSGRTWAK